MTSDLALPARARILLPGLSRYRSFYRPGHHCVFAGCPLGPAAQEGNFAIMAAPGTGKTLQYQTFFSSIVPFPRPGRTRRFLFHDKHRDTLAFLDHLGYPREKVRLTDPFLEEGARWDIAKDITTRADAHALGPLLIKEVTGDNSFFYDGARSLAVALADTLQVHSAGDWTFRDLIQILLQPKLIRHVLSHEPRHGRFIDKYFRQISKRTAFALHQTIDAEIFPFELVAELWSHAKTTFSIRDWLRSESSLVLGNPEKHKATVQAANKLLFTRLAQELLDGPDTNSDETWLGLDELADTAELLMLPPLMFGGRAKGVRTVVVIQSLPSLRINYRPDVAMAIAGLCQNFSFLRQADTETAEWASRRIGEYESLTKRWHFERNESSSRSGTMGPGSWTEGSSEGFNFDYERVTTVYPSELLNIPLPGRGGVIGCHVIPASGSVFWNNLQYPFSPRDQEAYRERDPSLQRSRPLDASDWGRLRLKSPKGTLPRRTTGAGGFREPLPLDDELFS